MADDNLRDRGMQLFWVMVAFMILASIFVFLRAYVKIVMVKKVSLDDYLMFFGFVVYIVYGVIAITGITNGGTGKHASQITVQEAVVSLRAWYLCEVLYSPITGTVRTSVCLLLLRIAPGKIYRRIIWVNIGVILATSTAYFVVMVIQCSPPSYFWEQLTGAKGFCRDINMVPDATIAHSCIMAVSDWVIGLLPVALLWNVQLNRRTKVTIAALLSMGVLAGVALVVRIPFVRRLTISKDFLYETIDVAIWSVIEPSIGIIAGCVATLRPLFKNMGFGWTSGTRRSGAQRRSTGRSGPNTRERTFEVKGSKHSRTATDEESLGSQIELNGPPVRWTVGASSSGPPAAETADGVGEMPGSPQSIHVHTMITLKEQKNLPPLPERWRREELVGAGGPVARPPSAM